MSGTQDQPSETLFTYGAFISYSHHDSHWANWLHSRLERYRVPRSVHATRRRLGPIFKDREELPAADSLNQELDSALSQSAALIVICSTHAAVSKWVNLEVLRFRELRPGAPVLALLVPTAEPEADVPFPPAMLDASGQDAPLAADMRSDQDGKRDAALKIIAGLLDVRFDALKHRETTRQLRRMTALAGLVTIVAVGFAIVTAAAIAARQDADRRQAQAEGLIGFMLNQLRPQLEPLGQLGLLDSVSSEAMQYFGSLEETDATDEVLLNRSRALRQIGDMRLQQGQMTDAVAAFDAALVQSYQLLERKPQDSARRFELGQAEFWLGYARWQAGDFTGADLHLRRYRELSAELVQQHPANSDYRLELAFAISNLGTLAVTNARYEDAGEYFDQAISEVRRLNHSEPENLGYQRELARMLSWQATNQRSLGDPVTAGKTFDQQVVLARALHDMDPDNAPDQFDLVIALLHAGELQLDLGDEQETQKLLQQAITLNRQLIALDPTNLVWRAGLARGLRLAGTAALGWRPASEAGTLLAEAEQILAEIVSVDAQQVAWRRAWVQTLLLLAEAEPLTAAAKLDQAQRVMEDLRDESLATQLVLARALCMLSRRVAPQANCDSAIRLLNQLPSGVADARIAAERHYAVYLQNAEEALIVSRQLVAVGYAEPNFLRRKRRTARTGKATEQQSMPTEQYHRSE